MARKRGLAGRVVRAVTDALWERDQLEMRAADALLAPFERARRSRSKSARAQTVKRPRR